MGPNVPLYKDAWLDRWEVRYSLTNPQSNWREVFEWCWSTFGHPGTDPETGVKSAWDYHGGCLRFYDKETVLLYTLRWS